MSGLGLEDGIGLRRMMAPYYAVQPPRMARTRCIAWKTIKDSPWSGLDLLVPVSVAGVGPLAMAVARRSLLAGASPIALTCGWKAS